MTSRARAMILAASLALAAQPARATQPARSASEELFADAERRFGEADFEGAFASLVRASAAAPSPAFLVRIIWLRAIIEETLGRPDDALASFVRAIRLDPELEGDTSKLGSGALARVACAKRVARTDLTDEEIRRKSPVFREVCAFEANEPGSAPRAAPIVPPPIVPPPIAPISPSIVAPAAAQPTWPAARTAALVAGSAAIASGVIFTALAVAKSAEVDERIARGDPRSEVVRAESGGRALAIGADVSWVTAGAAALVFWWVGDQ